MTTLSFKFATFKLDMTLLPKPKHCTRMHSGIALVSAYT